MRDETQRTSDFALLLTAGTYEGGVLEVRRLILSRDHRKHWEARRYTLSQQIEASAGVGAWGHILQQSGRRWVWTTAQGRAQFNTLERWTPRFPIEVLRGRDRRELQAEVMRSVNEGMREAAPDLRSRRVTVRGFDPQEITQRWRFEDFRDRGRSGGVSRGSQRLSDEATISPDEVDSYLLWLEKTTEPWVIQAVGGLPVSATVMRLAEEHAPEWVSPLKLTIVDR